MTGLIFHLIPHTHWDREWYLPRAVFQARLVAAVDELIERLQGDSAYRSFLLDGQTVLIEDYLRARPEREADVRALVKTGRLQVGRWYVLPDEHIPSGGPGRRSEQHFRPTANASSRPGSRCAGRSSSEPWESTSLYSSAPTTIRRTRTSHGFATCSRSSTRKARFACRGSTSSSRSSQKGRNPHPSSGSDAGPIATLGRSRACTARAHRPSGAT